MKKLTIFFSFLMLFQLSLDAQIPKTLRTGVQPLKPVDTVPGKVITPVQPLQPVLKTQQTATIVPTQFKDPLRGFADLHCHQMANMGFGGQAFHGKAFGPIDIALPSCAIYHSGIVHDFSGWIMQVAAYNINKPDGLDGFPTFSTWPSWYNITHQAVYQASLYRAFQGGLRLMVMLAVNNEHKASMVNTSWPWDDETAIIKQIDEAYAMQTYIDGVAGGVGKGWYRIVKTPQEARQAIINNQLAVVLGIEVDYPFGSKDEINGAGYTLNTMIDKLNFYYSKGVRHIFPIHFDNNFLGGASFDKSLDDDLETFDLTDGSIRVYKMNTYDGRSLGYLYYGGKANVRGLLPTGKRMVREMMKRGMIIDADHMSRNAKNDLLTIAESVSYPAIVSGHSGFIDISKGDKRHEGNLRADEVDRIYKLGGMVAPILWQGDYYEIVQYSPKVHLSSGASTEAWANAYLYAKDKMPGRPIAVGTDFNGGIPATCPRFGPDSSPFGKSAVNANPLQVVYPFVDLFSGQTRLGMSKLGNREFNINTDGFAHYGMFPDFLSDLMNVGLTPQDLEPLFNSAKYYIDMWEKAINKANSTNWAAVNGNRIDEGIITDTDGDAIEFTIDVNSAPADQILVSFCLAPNKTWEKRIGFIMTAATPPLVNLMVKDNNKCSQISINKTTVDLIKNGSIIFSKEKGILNGGVRDVKVIPWAFFKSLPLGSKISFVWTKD